MGVGALPRAILYFARAGVCAGERKRVPLREFQVHSCLQRRLLLLAPYKFFTFIVMRAYLDLLIYSYL